MGGGLLGGGLRGMRGGRVEWASRGRGGEVFVAVTWCEVSAREKKEMERLS